MYSPTPKLNRWYKLPDAETFRVTDIEVNKLTIQYSDGAFETVEMDIWYKLGAMQIEPDNEWQEDDKPANEIDFIELGVAPGTEGADYSDLLGGHKH